MLNRKNVTAILVICFFVVSGVGFAQGLADNFNDFLHYTRIGHLDLAKGYAKAIIDGNPDPVQLLDLSDDNPHGYAILLRAKTLSEDAELADLSSQILDIIEKGRFIKRANPKVIAEEIRRLTGTSRGRLVAVKRLTNAGEYAIPYMLDAMADDTRKEELPNVIWALPQIGRDSIRPLTTALQAENLSIKAEIIKALGKVGYPQSLAYLKYIVENDTSSELRNIAQQSIDEIDPAAKNISSAQLFYKLAENYYYHTESLSPKEQEDFANVWFWDSLEQGLIRQKVDIRYFYELMAMRACEGALKADPAFGKAIGLWIAAYFKAESVNIEMPQYFGQGHAAAIVYATTAGPEYLHQALARAMEDKDAYIALGVIEALATTAGEKSLLYRIGVTQPLIKALTFDDQAVRFSAAIAIAAAGPKENFSENRFVVENLAKALAITDEDDLGNEWVTENYAARAVKVMFELAQTKNHVINLSDAQNALVAATKDNRPRIQIHAGKVLAYLDSPRAQRAIAAMAMEQTNDKIIRVVAFDSLAISAKLNANKLDDEMIDDIYTLVSSKTADPELRSVAAAAFGALNLPSQKVKNLILDQAKN